ncbi:preprotein translocase subunit SecG [Synergistaceae bacterium OttesenSCG-928-I11]|nr:preprotein translocase subunit SecG [Synergistaceae bacterium OttesenSCG-928-I11]
MKILLSAAFIVLCIALMGVILMQHRKSGGFTGSFGGGGTQMDTSGGSWQRMTSMTKITVVLTGVFMVLALLLVKF